MLCIKLLINVMNSQSKMELLLNNSLLIECLESRKRSNFINLSYFRFIINKIHCYIGILIFKYALVM